MDNFVPLILCSWVHELSTIKMLLPCWSTAGRPQLQLRAHMAFNAEHSKLPLSGAWQRGKKSQTEAYIRLRQAGDKRYTVCKSQWLKQLAFSSHFLYYGFLGGKKTFTMKLFAAFFRVQRSRTSPSSKTALYLSLCSGPKHTGQHSSLTSGPLSIPNLSGHIPLCLFDD